jgi:hypothetical protein
MLNEKHIFKNYSKNFLLALKTIEFLIDFEEPKIKKIRMIDLFVVMIRGVYMMLYWRYSKFWSQKKVMRLFHIVNRIFVDILRSINYSILLDWTSDFLNDNWLAWETFFESRIMYSQILQKIQNTPYYACYFHMFYFIFRIPFVFWRVIEFQ